MTDPAERSDSATTPSASAGSQPGYPPPGYAPPVGYAPPAGYVPPAGYAGPVSSPAASQPTTAYPTAAYPTAAYPGATAPAAASGYPSVAPARRGAATGVIALVLALVATVGAGVAGALASFRVGLGAGREIANLPFDAGFDWSILSPVRDWVLLGEIAFWTGTVLGITALVLGIVAIATRRGRGAGIAAVVIAAVGPFAFGGLVQGFLTAGFSAGSGIGG